MCVRARFKGDNSFLILEISSGLDINAATMSSSLPQIDVASNREDRAPLAHTNKEFATSPFSIGSAYSCCGARVNVNLNYDFPFFFFRFSCAFKLEPIDIFLILFDILFVFLNVGLCCRCSRKAMAERYFNQIACLNVGFRNMRQEYDVDIFIGSHRSVLTVFHSSKCFII